MITQALLLTALAFLAPQDDGQPSAGPQINVNNGSGAPAASRDIPSIKAYRDGVETMPYVRRSEDVRDLDFSGVDFDAPVLATVNGHEIGQAEFRKWLAFAGGQNGVLRAQLVVLTKNSLDRILAGSEEEGAADRFVVTDEDVDARIREEEDLARAQGEAALEQYRAGIEATIGLDRYRTFVKTHLQSERILLPPVKPVDENTTELQGLPVEAAELLDDQPQLRDYLNNSYLNGQAIPTMFRTNFLRMLQQEMIKQAEIVYAVEDPSLKEGVYMTVEGTEVPVEDILDFVPEGRDIRERALRLCLLYHAMDDELAKLDAVISADDFALLFASHEAEYAGTIFPLQSLINLRGFLNMAEYREYFRRRVAFQKHVESGLDVEGLDAELQALHGKLGKLFYQSGKVTADIIFVSYENALKHAGTPEAAWAEARAKAETAFAMLKEGKSITEVRDEMGDVLPTEASGSLVGKMRNELRSAVGESDYNIFVTGYSVCDDIFYNRVEDELVGPVKLSASVMPGIRSSLGYVIAIPRKYQTTTVMKPFDAQRQLVHSDYFDLRFTYWAHECLKNADIELAVDR